MSAECKSHEVEQAHYMASKSLSVVNGMSISSLVRKALSERMKQRILHSIPYRLSQRLRLPHAPICFSVEFTTKCNVKCDMCTRFERLKSGHLSVGEMEDDIVSRIIEEMTVLHNKGRAVYLLPMGLGEMLMYSKLFDVFHRLKSVSKHIPISLTTNGTLLNDETIEKILDVGVNDIVISLNAYNATLYKKRMGPDSYDLVHENIHKLFSAKKRRSATEPSVYIQYLQYNEDELPHIQKEIKKWAKYSGSTDKCFIHPIVNQAGYFETSSFSESSERFPCTQPLWRVATRINGDMYPCDSSFYAGNEPLPSLYLGNIRDVNPSEFFLDKNSQSRAILDKMRRDDYSQLPLCDRCNTYKIGCNVFFKPPFRSHSGYAWR